MTPSIDDERPQSSESIRLLWVFAETTVATAVALYLALRLATSLVWLVLGLCLILARRGSISPYGLDLRICPPSLRVHAILGPALLFLYSAGHVAISILLRHQIFAFKFPENPLADLARELLIVAFPEEVFFRAYVQSRWDLAWGKPWDFFGAPVGPGLLAQAVLFAICHVASGDWLRASVFFFALLAGWLRARSGSVLGGVVYHTVANFWVHTLSASFR
jgi:membrane protease YdiL (CAAX protease family)